MKASFVSVFAILVLSGVSLKGQTAINDGTGAVTSTGTAGTAPNSVSSAPNTVSRTYTQANLEAVFRRIDANGDGVIRREEFAAAAPALRAAFGGPMTTDTTGPRAGAPAPGSTTPSNPR